MNSTLILDLQPLKLWRLFWNPVSGILSLQLWGSIPIPSHMVVDNPWRAVIGFKIFLMLQWCVSAPTWSSGFPLLSSVVNKSQEMLSTLRCAGLGLSVSSQQLCVLSTLMIFSRQDAVHAFSIPSLLVLQWFYSHCKSRWHPKLYPVLSHGSHTVIYSDQEGSWSIIQALCFRWDWSRHGKPLEIKKGPFSPNVKLQQG